MSSLKSETAKMLEQIKAIIRMMSNLNSNTATNLVQTTKSVSEFTVMEQRGDLQDFLQSKAHCNPTDFKLGAGLAKQIK